MRITSARQEGQLEMRTHPISKEAFHSFRKFAAEHRGTQVSEGENVGMFRGWWETPECLTHENMRPSSLKVLRPSSQDLDLSVVMANR